ncbi:YeaC family protein [Halioxenophilus sp. WMMB6]|uniref:YeaC family protein n=1 Tax=Halioxenophilus sp. WMMB6 TaxID=3073815 RepID=UPI00295EE24B|nr:DUF1315 family protein [Halioxenophilus sp. WMMB6]
MDYQQLLESITPEIWQNLRRAIEIGKWPNGQPLTVEQRENCLQAIIAYEAKNLPAEQRTGYVPPKKACASDSPAEDEPSPLKWQ